ncbi:MAG: carboxylating nicotinate-nucleotide diphosphorylase [Acidibacillus sp.]|uniref:Probable nicotinate-nucleotide pyrophosphorylase [carboxylating] n=1 Tax=Sulfoacidibacillus ferrooxidans TaxID=2005001 RepID=A0A9X1V9V0_9BACL|nr:carboxylating nicotinate-nucleotide diphosphorylase [Sulfoacidibacillus ferrooxidans]MCI0184053.1 putative nicotinate-nucleotide pyrophosphorylase (carboxylating) [Sulfoacidibacillus ferrooxidans]MCY0892712.1 carboxylating nicotinate-nucleotide diphosphorylase [Acidibacillus sp.]
MNQLLVQQIIKNALIEDIGTNDLTTELIFEEEARVHAVLIAKSPGRVAGLSIAKQTFLMLDPEVIFEARVADGMDVLSGTILADIVGRARGVLSAERVALNVLQRMSGIATQTQLLCEKVKDYPTQIVDTRKTLPGLRMFDKYAVTVGGGRNHRFGLYDAVLIKDNHIAAMGSITAAVTRVKEKVGPFIKIEVETDTLDQVAEAIKCPIDVILLDNMNPQNMRVAVNLVAKRMLTEASGGVTPETVQDYAKTGVDLISVGWLTHSVRALDISLDILGVVL